MIAEDIFYKHVEGVGTKQSIINAMEDYGNQYRESLFIAIDQIKHFREQLAMIKRQKAHWKDYYNSSKHMESIRKIISYEEYTRRQA